MNVDRLNKRKMLLHLLKAEIISQTYMTHIKPTKEIPSAAQVYALLDVDRLDKRNML
jgi:hypothetical protein